MFYYKLNPSRVYPGLNPGILWVCATRPLRALGTICGGRTTSPKENALRTSASEVLKLWTTLRRRLNFEALIQSYRNIFLQLSIYLYFAVMNVYLLYTWRTLQTQVMMKGLWAQAYLYDFKFYFICTTAE